MYEFATGFLLRAAVLVPTMVVVVMALWALMKKLGYMRLDQPFSGADTRTWPLPFAVFDAIVYGLMFAVSLSVFGEGMLSTGAAAAITTLIALHLVPRLVSRRSC
jgi:hypothetical protein